METVNKLYLIPDEYLTVADMLYSRGRLYEDMGRWGLARWYYGEAISYLTAALKVAPANLHITKTLTAYTDDMRRVAIAHYSKIENHGGRYD